jgi:hypothetical protein
MPNQNANLPYDTDQDRVYLLQKIKDTLAESLTAGDLDTGGVRSAKLLTKYFISLCQAFIKLPSYLDLKYPLDPSDRIAFIEVFMELILLPDLPPSALSCFTSVCSKLLKYSLIICLE